MNIEKKQGVMVLVGGTIFVGLSMLFVGGTEPVANLATEKKKLYEQQRVLSGHIVELYQEISDKKSEISKIDEKIGKINYQMGVEYHGGGQSGN